MKKVHFFEVSYRFVAVWSAPAHFEKILNNALIGRTGGSRGRWKRGWRRGGSEWRAPWRLHRTWKVDGEIWPSKLIKGRQWGGKLRGMRTARQLHEEHSGRALCHGLLIVHQSLWGPAFTRSERTAVINFPFPSQKMEIDLRKYSECIDLVAVEHIGSTPICCFACNVSCWLMTYSAITSWLSLITGNSKKVETLWTRWRLPVT